MDVELFVHGVPSGEGFWGKEEERSYFGNFYGNSMDEVRFLIQSRVLNGKSYCYYNYLVYKNIVGNEGRAGSYFGISLRFDAYCKDVLNMYRIFDTVYNVYIIGDLLKADKGKYKYTTPNFTSVSAKLEKIRDHVYQLIQNAFSSDSFVNMAGFPANASGNCQAFNLYDCTQEQMQETMRRNGIMAVSPYYQSSSEVRLQQQCNAQIQAAQKQCEVRLQASSEERAKERDELKTSLSSAKSRISQLEKDVSDRDNKIETQKSEIARLKSNVNKAEQAKKIEKIVEPIRKPIDELSEAFKVLLPEQHHGYRDGGQKKKSKQITGKTIRILLTYINFVLLLFVVFALLSLPKKLRTNVEPDDAIEVADTVAQVTDEQHNQTNGIDTGEGGEVENPFKTAVSAIPDVKIDIKGYSSGELKKNAKYKVEAKNGGEKGSWKVEGCEVKETDNPDIIEITPTSDYVNLQYVINGNSIERKLKAK